MTTRLIILFAIVSTQLGAQTDEYEYTNRKRLSELHQLREESIATKDYATVVQLDKELSIRNHLDYAYTHGGTTEQVILLKDELSKSGCIPSSKQYEIDGLRASVVKWRKKGGEENRFHFYVKFLPAAFVNTAQDSYEYNWVALSNNPSSPYINSIVRDEYSYRGMGFKLGSSFFFSDYSPSNKFRVGLDLCFFSFMLGIATGDVPLPGIEMIALNYPQPGIVLSTQFNKKSGLDIKTNMGICQSFGFRMTGLSGTFSCSYWINKLSFGLDYQYGTSAFNAPINKSRVHQLSLNLGWRF